MKPAEQKRSRPYTTVQIPNTTLNSMDGRMRAGESRQACLQRDLAAMQSLMESGLRRARRVLTRSEATLILDVQNGAIVEPVALWMDGGLRQQMDDAITLDGADARHGVDGQALLAKLDGMGDLGQIALVDWAAGMWSRHDNAAAWQAGLALFRE